MLNRHTPLRVILLAAFLSCLSAIPACTATPDQWTPYPMEDQSHWIRAARVIDERLGATELAIDKDVRSPRANSSLRLHYDLRDVRGVTRTYCGAYCTAGPIHGQVDELTLPVLGDGTGHELRVMIEDVRGRWFERSLGLVDWTGWREISIPVGKTEGWEPILRVGEPSQPIQQPIALRQIALYHRKNAKKRRGNIYFGSIQATGRQAPIDLVDATTDTGRKGNLFALGETVEIRATARNMGSQSVAGELSLETVDFFGRTRRVGSKRIDIAPGGEVAETFRFDVDRADSYEMLLRLKNDAGERIWVGRMAVIRTLPHRPADENARFGINGNIRRFFAPDEMDLVYRLNRDAGCRWGRSMFFMPHFHPAPGVWTWQPPSLVDGAVGRAVAPMAAPACLVVNDPPAALDAKDELTIAFWVRGGKVNKNDQAVVSKSFSRMGPASPDLPPPSYRVSLRPKTGQLAFSGRFEKLPPAEDKTIVSDIEGMGDTWRHLAVTFSSNKSDGRVTFYLNGQPAKTVDVGLGALRPGDAPLFVTRRLSAELDELTIFNRALTADEIAALAERKQPEANGLAAWWSFDEVTPATTIADRSASGADLAVWSNHVVPPLREAQRRGLGLVGFFWGLSPFATTAPKGVYRRYIYPPRLDVWAPYVEEMARHYSDLIKYWEVWNEPNIPNFWLPGPDPEKYFELLKVSAPAIRRGAPDCKVLMPALAGPYLLGGRAMHYMDRLLKLGASNHCDVIAIHNYRRKMPEVSDVVAQLRHIDEMARRHGSARDIWITECGITSELPAGASDRYVAMYLPRLYSLCFGTGLVKRMYWYQLRDSGVDRFQRWKNCGLIYHDFTPKFSYLALQTFARLLEGVVPDGAADGRDAEWDLGPHALGRCLRGQAGRVAVIWSTSGAVEPTDPQSGPPVAIYVGAPSVRIVDIVGQEREQPTDDGIIVLRAGGAVQYLVDLPDSAEPRGAVLAGPPVRVTRGGQGALRVTVRNPYTKARKATLRVEADAPITLEKSQAEIELAPGTAEEVAFPFRAKTGKSIDRRAVVTLQLGEEQYQLATDILVRQAPGDAGPVAAYTFDEQADDETVRDVSGHGNDAPLCGAKRIEGRQGGALYFDADSPGLSIADAPELDLADEVTISYWIKLDEGTGKTFRWPLTKGHKPASRNYASYLVNRDDPKHRIIKANQPRFSASLRGDPAPNRDGGPTVELTPGQWHHVAFCYSANENLLRSYVDGRRAAYQKRESRTMKVNNHPLVIGRSCRAALDDVAIYPRALTEKEIAELAR